MKRKLVMIAMAVLSVVIAFGIAACGDKPEPKPAPTVTLSETSLSLDKYACVTLNATTTGEADGGIVWTASDDTIVSVDGGRIIALKAGSATITATYGEASATCSVTVSDAAGKTPTLKVAKTYTQIFKDGTYTIEPKLSFDGSDYDDATFAFVSSDTEILSVSTNGIVTGLAYGTATVTVTGSWRGAGADILFAEVCIKVVPDISIELLDANDEKQSVFTVYTIGDLEGEDFDTSVVIKAKVQEDRQPTAAPVTWEIEDEMLLSCENGVFTSEGIAGETTVTASVTIGGEKFESAPVTVKVIKPVVTKNISKDVDLRFEIGADFNPFADGKSVTEIVDVTDPANETNLSYNAEGGTFDKTAIVAGERKWRIYNDTYGYEIDVVAASIIVKTPQDLVDMYGILKKDVFVYEGYVVLAADLDFSDFDYKNAPGVSPWSPRGDKAFGFYANTPGGFEADWERLEWNADKWLSYSDGFSGTFDGRGHVISNLKVDLYGIFPAINKGSTFKNVAFMRVDVMPNTGVIAAAVNGTVENVYIEASANNIWDGRGCIGGVAMVLGDTAVLKNVVSAVNFASEDCALRDERDSEKTHKTIDECGVIAASYNDGATLDNVYAIGNGTPFATFIKNIGGDTYSDNNRVASGFFSDAFQSDIEKFDAEYWDIEGGIPQWKNLLTIDVNVNDVVVGALAPVTVSANSASAGYLITEVPEKIENYVSVSETTITVSAAVDTIMSPGEILTFKVGVRLGDATKAMSTVSIRIIKPDATAVLSDMMIKGDGEAVFAITGMSEAADNSVTVVSGGVTINGIVVPATIVVRTSPESVKYLSVVPETAIYTGDTVTIKAGSILKVGDTYYLTAGAFTQIKVADGSGYAGGDYCELKNVAFDTRGSWGSNTQVRFRHDNLNIAETSGTIISGRILKNGVAFTDYTSFGYFADTVNSSYGTLINFAFADYDRVTLEAGLTVRYGDTCYRFTESFTLVNVPIIEGAVNVGGCCGYGGGVWAEPLDLYTSEVWSDNFGDYMRVQINSAELQCVSGITEIWTANIYSDWVSNNSAEGAAVYRTRDGIDTGLKSTEYQIFYQTGQGFGTSINIMIPKTNACQKDDIVTIKKGSVVIFSINGIERYYVITSTVSQKMVDPGQGGYGGVWSFCETPPSLVD